jgi:DMSO/TMAO reductase YedYZ heme-binding membrane subunit
VSIESDGVMKNKYINKWRLFWLITGPLSMVMLVAMLGTDMSSGEGVSSMIRFSVRSAIPWLYLAFAASSVQLLFPSEFSRWLLRNRKFIGLCFAAAMAWQLFFIIWLTTVHNDYYVKEVYVLRDVFEGILGYFFLIAMTITSFSFGRKKLTPRQWKYLHKIGIYSLWIYAFSVYWWALYSYPDPDWVSYTFYWGGFLAWGLRIAAWRKKTRQQAERKSPQSGIHPAYNLAGSVLILIGVIAVGAGSVWATPATTFLTGYAITEPLELYLPYWPFEPYLPIFLIALGALLTTKSRA